MRAALVQLGPIVNSAIKPEIANGKTTNQSTTYRVPIGSPGWSPSSRLVDSANAGETAVADRTATARVRDITREVRDLMALFYDSIFVALIQVRDNPHLLSQNRDMTNSLSLDWFLGEPLRIIIIFLAAFVIRFVVTRASNRVIRQAFGTNERRDQRSSTISTVLNTITTVMIWGTAFLMALTVMGVNIGPLLASAGIIGVALGFGAQTLVKDYISGIFLIIEDQYGIGDEVEIGTVRGIVEAVALRTTRVRDEAGVLWYIRNGEILNVANFSQNTSWEKK